MAQRLKSSESNRVSAKSSTAAMLAFTGDDKGQVVAFKGRRMTASELFALASSNQESARAKRLQAEANLEGIVKTAILFCEKKKQKKSPGTPLKNMPMKLL